MSSSDRFSKSHDNVDMIIKTDRITAVAAASAINSPSSIDSPDNPIKNGKKKRIFSSKRDERGGSDEDIFKSDDGGIDLDLEKSFATRRKTFLETHVLRKGFTAERQTSPEIEGLNLSTFEESMTPATELQDIRLFVATWNVGGKTPNNGLNLEDFLQAEDSADIYVLGFQEIVPLSAGNVLVIEDNEPAVKWLALISQALNKPQFESIYSSSDVGPGSKVSNNNITRDSSKCTSSLNFFQRPSLRAIRRSFRPDSTLLKSCNCQDSPSRDSHLASGEKEGDELKRNADVCEILKCTQFPKICKNPNSRAPERINDHDRVIWLGDLNYRVALTYEETRVLLEDNDWDTLLEKDQLNLEREAGRVFHGFDEGRIYFAPTYKYTHNSDSYAGETVKSKKKRRTPAWCDRILWRGNGIEQLSYIRGESRFSDHRPVCAVFTVEVEVENKNNNRFRMGYTCAGQRFDFEDCIPQRHSLYEL
nr:type i inositol polyphosphate 5-phosphatase 5 [Quercus suber]